jgi:hypothetical protein
MDLRMIKKRRTKRPEYPVFISHATADKWIAVQLDKMIKSVTDPEIPTFRDDRDIEAGTKIPETVRTRLRSSRELLVLWTPQAMASEWVKFEVSMAYGWELHIVAIRYLTSPKDLPLGIKTDLSPELTEQDVNKYLEGLKSRARRFKEKES